MIPLAGDNLEWLGVEGQRLVAIDAFASWLVKAFPALAWLRRSDRLRPPFAPDNGLRAFALGVVPWILAGANGEPPRTRLEWERANTLIDLHYRDWLRYMDSHRANSAVDTETAASTDLAPLALQVGESEREFLARARAHARARQRDCEQYLTNDPTHPLHAEAARRCRTGERGEPFRWPDDLPLMHRPRQLELHATWWALHHVEGQTAAQIAGHAETERNVEKQIAAMGRYYRGR